MSKHHSGKYYVGIAERNNLCVENGRGDHVKVRDPQSGQSTVIPMHRELATGTECSIRKWFIKMGIVLIVLLMFYQMYLLGII